LWVKLTIKKRDQSEESNYWFGLRAVNTISFCANQPDDERGNYYINKTNNDDERGNYYIDKTSKDDRDDYFHNLHRRHGDYLRAWQDCCG